MPLSFYLVLIYSKLSCETLYYLALKKTKRRYSFIGFINKKEELERAPNSPTSHFPLLSWSRHSFPRGSVIVAPPVYSLCLRGVEGLDFRVLSQRKVMNATDPSLPRL